MMELTREEVFQEVLVVWEVQVGGEGLLELEQKVDLYLNQWLGEGLLELEQWLEMEQKLELDLDRWLVLLERVLWRLFQTLEWVLSQELWWLVLALEESLSLEEEVDLNQLSVEGVGQVLLEL